jgi:hypothetical protein
MLSVLAIVLVSVFMLSSVRSFGIKSIRRSFHSSSSLNMGLHDHTLKDLSGKDVKLDSYKGKVVLLENVATL